MRQRFSISGPGLTNSDEAIWRINHRPSGLRFVSASALRARPGQ
jgi:hypothetical protein